jgi:glycolate oxidase FAD binding subunit
MNATRTVSALERDFQAIVGAEHVQDGRNLAAEGVNPAWVLRPANEEEISAILRLCSANDLVVVSGAGLTKQGIGTPMERTDVFLDMARLNRVLRYDPGDLTISVEAGARVGEVQSVVAAHRQLLPLDGPQCDRSSIGGALATAMQGPLKHGFGGPRDFCVGIRFVTADGTMAKAGGQVVKNVAGYDLMKLLIGSYGTLAVITRANFKLHPASRQFRTFVSSFGNVSEAANFRDAVLRSPLAPVALEIVSPVAEGYLSAMLHGGSWHIVLRASGSDAVLQRYRTELGGAVVAELSGDEEQMLWRSLADFPANLPANALVMDVSAPVAHLAEIMNVSDSVAAQCGFFMAAAGRALGPWNLALLPMKEQPDASAYQAVLHEIRSAVPSDGAAVVTHCPTAMRAKLDVWGRTSTDLEAMRTVKRAMDPRNILNRGRFLF